MIKLTFSPGNRAIKRIILLTCFMFLIFICIGNYLISNSGSFLYGNQFARSRLQNYDFDYVINNDICTDDIYLLVLVHSAVNHFQHRQVIRDTWGNPGPYLPLVKVVFLLAIADDFQRHIEDENEQHKDIIQADFIDSYHNLTYKHAMGLSWASANCNRTKFILKMDDDIFMDIYQLLEYVQDRLTHFNLENSIACYHQKSMPVVRDPVSKWYVSKSEYSSDTFEDYCSGWAYLTTPRVASLLYQAVKKFPYFWVDDVHLTGTVRKTTDVRLIRLNHLYALETDGLSEWCRSSDNLRWNKVFAPTWGDMALVRRAHVKCLTCYVKNCSCCYYRKTTPKPTTTSTTVRGIAQLISF